MASRGEGHGKSAAAAAAALAASLSIRGTGHIPAGRSPIHGSSPSYLGDGRNNGHTKGSSSDSSRTSSSSNVTTTKGRGSTSSNSGVSRSVHPRGIGGGGVSTSRPRPRTSGNFGRGLAGGIVNVAGRGRTPGATSAAVPAINAQKREGGSHDSGGHEAGGGHVDVQGQGIGGDSNTNGAVGTAATVGGTVAAATARNLRPWTARQREGYPSSPRLAGSRSGAGGSDLESVGVGGGGGRGDADRAAAAATSDGGCDMVKIHVCDESRGITRDFPCERELLLREMKYFQSYLVGASRSCDEIDILVHCDVRIFEWLFQYIHSTSTNTGPNSSHENGNANGSDCSGGVREGGSCGGGGGGGSGPSSRELMNAGRSGPPSLEVPLAVSILISSDFLQMQRLVAECLGFVGEHLTEIVKLPIDLSCLGDKMVLQLAKIVSLEQLAVAKDRKDKLLSRVHKKRIELDFRDRSPNGDTAIYCCRHCAGLFSEKVRNVLTCPAAPPTVGFRGELLRRHEALSPWSLTRTVTSLHRRGMTWTTVYWLLWGLTQPLYCIFCSEVFLAGDMGQCHYHPQEDKACLPGGSSDGAGDLQAGADRHYPCCNKTAYRFGLDPEPLGCKTRDHVVREEDEDPRVLRVLRLQRPNVSFQDWRTAVWEETSAAVKAAPGPSNSGGDGVGRVSVGVMQGGAHGDSNSTVRVLGGGYTGEGGGGGVSGARDKVAARRHLSASSRRRPPRGPDAPPAVVTTTTTTITKTIDAITSVGGSSRPASPQGNRNGNEGGSSDSGTGRTPKEMSLSVSPSAAFATKRPASAGDIKRSEGTADGHGGSGSGSGSASGHDNINRATAVPGTTTATNAIRAAQQGESGEQTLGAEDGRGMETEGADGKGSTATVPASAPDLMEAVAIPLTPAVAAATGAAMTAAGVGAGSASGDWCRIWEARVSQALPDRERGLLPNEHPMQRAPPQQQRYADSSAVSAPRDWSRAGAGYMRRWQADALRESDGLRMAKMCDELRSKRRGQR